MGECLHELSRWTNSGLWLSIMSALRKRDIKGKCEEILIDATIVRAHHHAAGAKGGNPNKPSAALEEVFQQKNILRCLKRLSASLPYNTWSVCRYSRDQTLAWSRAPAVVIADTAYDSNKTRNILSGWGSQIVIPSHPQRKLPFPLDKEMYKKRCAVEIFINKVKQYRRLATRYDKTQKSYAAMVAIACIRIALRF